MSGIFTIEDLCEVQSGGTPSRSEPKYWNGSIPWVKISDMLRGRIRGTDELITEEGLENSSAKIFPAGTLLLSIFATIGRTAILDIPAATNQAIAGLRIKDLSCVDATFLRRYLDFIAPALAQRGRGAAQANINLSILRATKVELPELSDQRRIAAILGKADALRAQRRAAIAKLDELLQSVFIEMFGDSVTNPKGWPETTSLGDVAEIVSGITKGRKTTATTREVAYMAVSNVQERFLKLDVVKRIEATDDEIEKYQLRRNDLLLTEGGDPDKLGRGVLWHNEIEECIHQNHIFRVRLNSDQLHPLYLNWYVGSERGKRYFLRQSKQTTGIASINMRQLRGLPLLIPPLDLQQRFAQIAEKIESQKQTLHRAAEKSETLFASLQQLAFSGKL